MLRARDAVWRALPLLFLLGLYWPGLTNGFYQDDFGWLNLRHDVHSAHDLGVALFAPKAHGNMRPLGENAYFLVLSGLFGVNPLPFRILAFATQAASLVLLGSIARRITGSRAGGCWAQILWIANCGLAAAMSWTSIYNQLLSGFFFLSAFYFLLRHIETGERRHYLAQWAALVLGLGALETNVVYPALAAAYTLLFARPYLKKVLPMFLASALAVALHFTFAPPSHEGVYAPHLDAALFSTLWTYWKWALGPTRLAMIGWLPGPLAGVLLAALTIAVAWLLAWKARRREYGGLFAIAWFVMVLGPYLLLKDHLMDYYLTVPVIGVAIFGAWAIAGARKSRLPAKIGTWVCIAVYLGTSLPAAWAITRWHHARAGRVENLVWGVAEIHQASPGKIILLDGIDADLFWAGMVDLPFRAMEIPHVYLVPESDSRIQAPAGLLTRYMLPPALVLEALRNDRAVVYRLDGDVLRNSTRRFRAMAEARWKPELPAFINLGDSVYAEYLGPGWSECAGGYRPMSGAAAVHIRAPRSPDEHLYIGVFRTTEFRLEVRVNGADVPVELFRRDVDLSEFRAGLPASLIGAGTMEVALSSKSREPLVFGFVEIR